MKTFRYIDGAAVLRLDVEACIGCGICVTVCPHRIFELPNSRAEIVDYNACMECGACATNCPTEAIFVNSDDGCGCAALIIDRWISKVIGKPVSSCSC
ncbi:MAG: 4Fe-4S dicluster domain-containing protein [Desulfofustis sp.]|nr:4Fe-4S dicluster domain-containing protein [Desulfofustis sp.]